MFKDDAISRIITHKYVLLSLGILLTIFGLIILYFSLTLIYYFFIKKEVPKNKILRRMIALSQGGENVSFSFEEIEKMNAKTKIFNVIIQILYGIGFLFVGRLMLCSINLIQK